MKKICFILSLLCYSAFSQELIETLGGSSNNESFGSELSLSTDGNVIAVSSIFFNSSQGRVQVFERAGNDYLLMGSSFIGAANNGFFGRSLSISSNGMRVAMGSGLAGTSTTFDIVKIYDWDGTNWIQVGADLTGDVFNDGFGLSIDLSSDGNTIVVGSRSTPMATVKVFNWDGTSWNQIGQTISEAVSDLSFGGKVNISSDGNRIVVAATEEDINYSNSGSIRTYEYNGTTWVQIGSTITGTNASALFGLDLSISGDGNTIVITGQSGTFVYEWNTNTLDWDIKGSTTSAGVSKNEVSDNGNIMMQSSVIANFGDGLAKVRSFETDWVTIASFGMDDSNNGTVQRVGSGLGISGDGSIIAIGAEGTNSYNGVVRIYDLSLILSVDEVLNANFKIYPNPVINTLNFDITETIDSVYIYNVLGQEVAKYNSKNIYDNSIDVSNLLKGVYLAKIKAGDINETIRIIKK